MGGGEGGVATLTVEFNLKLSNDRFVPVCMWWVGGWGKGYRMGIPYVYRCWCEKGGVGEEGGFVLNECSSHRSAFGRTRGSNPRCWPQRPCRCKSRPT